MNKFNIKEFLTENKLTEQAKRLDEQLTFEDLPDAAKNLLANMGLATAGTIDVTMGPDGYEVTPRHGVMIHRGDLMRVGQYGKDGELNYIHYDGNDLTFVFRK